MGASEGQRRQAADAIAATALVWVSDWRRNPFDLSSGPGDRGRGRPVADPWLAVIRELAADAALREVGVALQPRTVRRRYAEESWTEGWLLLRMMAMADSRTSWHNNFIRLYAPIWHDPKVWNEVHAPRFKAATGAAFPSALRDPLDFDDFDLALSDDGPGDSRVSCADAILSAGLPSRGVVTVDKAISLFAPAGPLAAARTTSGSTTAAGLGVPPPFIAHVRYWSGRASLDANRHHHDGRWGLYMDSALRVKALSWLLLNSTPDAHQPKAEAEGEALAQELRIHIDRGAASPSLRRITDQVDFRRSYLFGLPGPKVPKARTDASIDVGAFRDDLVIGRPGANKARLVANAVIGRVDAHLAARDHTVSAAGDLPDRDVNSLARRAIEQGQALLKETDGELLACLMVLNVLQQLSIRSYPYAALGQTVEGLLGHQLFSDPKLVTAADRTELQFLPGGSSSERSWLNAFRESFSGRSVGRAISPATFPRTAAALAAVRAIGRAEEMLGWFPMRADLENGVNAHWYNPRRVAPGFWWCDPPHMAQGVRSWLVGQARTSGVDEATAGRILRDAPGLWPVLLVPTGPRTTDLIQQQYDNSKPTPVDDVLLVATIMGSVEYLAFTPAIQREATRVAIRDSALGHLRAERTKALPDRFINRLTSAAHVIAESVRVGGFVTDAQRQQIEVVREDLEVLLTSTD